jgi:hypothetical protein
MRLKYTLYFLMISCLLIPVRTVFASPRADIKDDQVTFSFPETATFSATLSSSSNINSVVLEYGNEQQTCGDVIAKAFPVFTPSSTVNAQWTWDMRQSGSLPPGATLWWRWRYTDESGAEFLSEKQTATWIDTVHNWQSISSTDLNLHYYNIDANFAQNMLNAGIEGLRRNKDQAGLVTDAPIDIYVYPNYNDMRDAILYEPSWTGGQAHPEFNIVIMGLSGSDSTWDQNTVIHELTHVLVGHFTFSCLGVTPAWLDEGLAMFSEGKLDSGMQSQLDAAIQTDQLITLRSLNGGFSELPDKANLSYSQAYSVVNFLVNTYGQDKMTGLLAALRDGKTVDDALLSIYGFNTDGLDDAWRASVGAPPRPVSAQPTSQPTPTYVPTYVPVTGAQLETTPTPYAVPTSSFDGSNNTPSDQPSGPPLSLTISLICFCLVFLILIGVIVLGVVVRMGNVKGGKNEQK